MKKVIIYGGSFNPFHNGHDAIVRYSASLDGYDEVWIMPSARRSDKPSLLGDSVRLEMLHNYRQSLTFYGYERVKVSDFEISLGAPSETSRTYLALKTHYPRYQFTFLFGADAVADMPQWHGGQKLLTELHLLIIARPESREQVVLDSSTGIRVPNTNNMSSTRIRKLILSEKPIDHLVPRAILNYITVKRLYV